MWIRTLDEFDKVTAVADGLYIDKVEMHQNKGTIFTWLCRVCVCVFSSSTQCDSENIRLNIICHLKIFNIHVPLYKQTNIQQ